MRIGIVSYPLLFQREAALQQQVRDTTRALLALPCCQGVELRVSMLGPDPAQLDHVDAIHVFSTSATSMRLIDAAAARRVPVVLSPLIPPGWDRVSGELARQADQDWQAHMGRLAPAVPSNYAQAQRALQLAQLVVATGVHEQRAIEEGFLIDGAKLRVFPHGVNQSLFEAEGDLFRLRTGIRPPFVLMHGPISPYHNQLGLAMALAGAGLPLVLLGHARERDQAYLQRVRAMRGVTCLGGLEQDPRLLASAYAAASVLVLPGLGEAGVRSMFDALATGTPVVACATGSPALPDSAHALRQVSLHDAAAQQAAVLDLIAHPPERAGVRALARPFTWERAALTLAACYISLREEETEAAVPA